MVRRAILDPLPYADGDRLVSVMTSVAGRTSSMSVFVLEDLKASRQDVLADIAQVRYSSPTYQTDDAAQTLEAQEVTAAFFNTFGVRPAMGGLWADTEPNAVDRELELLAAIAVCRSERDRPGDHAGRHALDRSPA